jgi:DNA-binding CsgD family transcriptional regulator
LNDRVDKSRLEGVSDVLEVWNDKNSIDNPNVKINKIDFVNQIASSFTPGPFYYYVFNFETMVMEYVHPTIKDVLGIDPKKFSIDYFFKILHPDDVEKMHEKEAAIIEFLFKKIAPEDLIRYKAVYVMRLQNSDGSYRKILHQARTINVSNDGKIQQVLGVHADITFLNNPVDHKVSFVGIDRPSYYSMDPKTMKFDDLTPEYDFTNREVQIIRFTAQGLKSEEIAEQLNLSVHTIKTHKKNILKKANVSNSMQLVANCIRSGVI